MRKVFAFGLMFVVAVFGMPVGALAQGGQTGTLQGVAKDATQKDLPRVKVQVRGPNGELVANGTTTGTGQFSFAGLNPGNYTIEIVDAVGNVVGSSAPVAVTAGATATVSVTAAAAGAIAAAAGGGVSLFGLGTIGTVAVVSGAAAITTAAVVATKDGKIVICHKATGAPAQTIEIKQSAWDTHQAHGDVLNACPASPSK